MNNNRWFFLASSPALGPKQYCQNMSNEYTFTNSQDSIDFPTQDEDQPGNN